MADTTDGVQVRLGADTGPATSGVSDAASSIAASLKTVQDTLQKFSAKSAETNSAVATHTKEMSSAFAGLSESVRVRLGSINSSFLQLRSGLLGLGESFAGFLVAREAVRALTDMSDSVRGLEIVFGSTAEKATQMSVALKLAGISADAYEEMALRVQRVLRTQPEEFERLGVSVKDSNGQFLDTETILQNVYKRMQDFKAGTDQNMFTLATVGRAAKGFAEDMQTLNSVTQRAAELQRELGIEMGPAKQASVQRYKIEFNAFKIALEEVGARIGEVLLPGMERMTARLVALAPQFRTLGEQAAKAFTQIADGIVNAFSADKSAKIDYLGNTLKSLSLVLAYLRTGIMQFIDTIGGLMSVQGAWAAATDNMRERLLHFDFSGATRVAQQAQTQILGIIKDTYAKLKNEYSDFQHDRDEILFGKQPGTAAASGGAAPIPRSGKLGFPTKPAGGSDDRLAAWRDELLQMQQAEGYFHEFSKAQEAAFWESKLALVKGKGQEDVNLRRELNRLIFDDRKAAANEELATDLAKFQRMIDAANKDKVTQIGIAEARTATIKAIYGEESKEYERVLDEELKIRQAWVAKEAEIMKLRTKMEETRAEHAIEMERLGADQELALRQITAQQRFAIETQLEDKLYAQRLTALNNLKSTLQAGTKEYVQAEAEIEKLEQDHQNKLTQIANQAELDRKQYALQAAQQTQDAFATFLSDLSSRAKTFSQAWKDMISSINSELTKLASQQIAKQLLGPGTEGGGFLNNLFGKIFGVGSSDTTGAAALTTAGTTLTTSGTVLTQAGTLLTTAAATLQAAAATLGAKGAGDAFSGLFPADSGPSFMSLFSGGLPAFDTGTPYVPRDMLAIVHRGEAVIPASMNKGGKAASAGMVVHNHFVIAGSVDERSQGQISAAAARGLAVAQRRHT